MKANLGYGTPEANNPLINSAHIPLAKGTTDVDIANFVQSEGTNALNAGTLTEDHGAYGLITNTGDPVSGEDNPEIIDPVGE